MAIQFQIHNLGDLSLTFLDFYTILCLLFIFCLDIIIYYDTNIAVVEIVITETEEGKLTKWEKIVKWLKED